MSSSSIPLIGITGGIGSGKSLVCRIFSTLRIPIYEADQQAKWLTTNDAPLRQSIIELLGVEAYTSTGEYNRNWIANRVFQDPLLLQSLNALIHPRVREVSLKWAHQQRDRNVPYLLYEAALMQAAGKGNPFTKVIVVNSPPELRLRHILKRDVQRSEADVKAIMERQLTDEERLQLADFILENNEQLPLLDQVLDLHQKLKKEFGR